MDPTANNDIQKYLSIMNEYYSVVPFPDEPNLNREKVLSLLTTKLKQSWQEADAVTQDWNALVVSLRNKPWTKFVRDWEKATPQAYKVIVGIEPGNNDPACSIVVFLSLIGRKIGFLYVDLLAAASNSRPFYEYSRRSSDSGPVSFASYFPLNVLHERYSKEILEEIRKFFPDFTLFDNQLADFKVEGVQTEEDYYTDMDLFLVFFERGLPAGVPT